jgi:hypothetical protein
MPSREYKIRGGYGVIASADVVELNPQAPMHLRCAANAVWITKGRYSNTGVVSDGYRESLGGVYLWYSEAVNFEASAVREEGEYFAMMEKLLSAVDLEEEGLYEVAVKNLSKSPIKKGVVKRLDYIPAEEDEMEILVIEEEGE